VRVHVDEPGTQHLAGAVDDLIGRQRRCGGDVADRLDGGDAPSASATSAANAGAPVPSTTETLRISVSQRFIGAPS